MANLNLNTVDGLTKMMNEMNNVFNNKIKQAELKECINNIDNISFLECRQLFESISDKLYDLKEGSKLLTAYIKVIKESNELKRLYVCEDVLKNANNSVTPSLLVTETTNLMSKVDKKKLNEAITKIRKILKESVKLVKATKDEITSAINENKDINKDITFVLMESAKPSNVVEYTNAIGNVINFVSENTKELNECLEKATISDVENLLNNDLELWENAAIEKIVLSNLTGNSKKTIFENYKSNCLNLINELLEDDDNQTVTKSQLMNMREGLEKKEYRSENANEDILKLAQLENTLQN